MTNSEEGRPPRGLEEGRHFFYAMPPGWELQSSAKIPALWSCWASRPTGGRIKPSDGQRELQRSCTARNADESWESG